MAKYPGGRKKQEIRKKKPIVGMSVHVVQSTMHPGGDGIITNIIGPSVVEVKFTDEKHYRCWNNEVTGYPEKDEVASVSI
jgi:hypothetical protein